MIHIGISPVLKAQISQQPYYFFGIIRQRPRILQFSERFTTSSVSAGSSVHPKTGLSPSIWFSTEIIKTVNSSNLQDLRRFRPRHVIRSSTFLYHDIELNGMAPESNFADFGDLFTDADLYTVSILSISLSALVLRMQGLYLPFGLNFPALEDEPLSHDTFGLPLPLQIPHPIGEHLPTFFQQMPLDTTSTLGVTQNIFHSL